MTYQTVYIIWWTIAAIVLCAGWFYGIGIAYGWWDYKCNWITKNEDS